LATQYVYDKIYDLITALGETCYINSAPDTTNNICSLYYYDASKDPLQSFDDIAVRFSNMQIKVRDASFETGFDRANTIFTLFKHYSLQNIVTITPKSDIIMLGNDSKDRSLFSINFKIKMIGTNLVTK